jgi:hypothetical protein
VILATTGPVWSLSLNGSATYPLMSFPEQTGRRRAAAMLLASVLPAMVFFSEAAHAVSLQGTVVVGKWKSMDKCADAAQRAFPDFTAESNAKRDAKLKECLAGQNLPPRDAPSPAQ